VLLSVIVGSNTKELQEVALLLESMALVPGEDTRHNPLFDDNNMLQTAPSTCNFVKFVWENHASLRALFFA
jgi:hypothetical protein